MTDRYVYGDCPLCEASGGIYRKPNNDLWVDFAVEAGGRPCPLCALIEERAERYYRRADDIAAAKGKPPPKADPFLDRAIAELKEEGYL